MSALPSYPENKNRVYGEGPSHLHLLTKPLTEAILQQESHAENIHDILQLEQKYKPYESQLPAGGIPIDKILHTLVEYFEQQEQTEGRVIFTRDPKKLELQRREAQFRSLQAARRIFDAVHQLFTYNRFEASNSDPNSPTYKFFGSLHVQEVGDWHGDKDDPHSIIAPVVYWTQAAIEKIQNLTYPEDSAVTAGSNDYQLWEQLLTDEENGVERFSAFTPAALTNRQLEVLRDVLTQLTQTSEPGSEATDEHVESSI